MRGCGEGRTQNDFAFSIRWGERLHRLRRWRQILVPEYSRFSKRSWKSIRGALHENLAFDYEEDAASESEHRVGVLEKRWAR